MRVDQVLERQARVDEHLDRLGPVAVAVAIDPGRVVGHLVEHLAVGRANQALFLKKSQCP